jgi:phage-related protein
MSDLTYTPEAEDAPSGDKPLVWLYGEVKSPPFSPGARWEAGMCLRQLQRGEWLPMPKSRPMPTVGRQCHELRITDLNVEWRILYRIDADAIVVADVFVKKTAKTPQSILETCRQRLKRYDDAQDKT